ncbi:antA/AntB antirepressor family protein [Capnocytophaga sp. oral taxon 380]|uniref:antA/AntB antirepressor family protein n=1 Tax=Capnocytophaga sp. oral taxon 380 TaxID=712217 RepID=UPI0002A204A6|nr:antA/AntB antirepressor family protein [Capnocytophaga sp. oral taxon 380]EKY10413.1 toxin-antitoxin system, toxin component, Bro domain protein [Capnocytophaga sp. oral taxon 380 str. F0488]
MNDITIIEQNGIQLIDARELHRRLRVQSKFTNWFPRRVEEYRFDEGKDYFAENQLLPKNGQKVSHRPRTEYFLTIDMAKEIAMVERTEVGKKIRNYFIEMEKIAQQSIIKMPPSLNVYGKEALPYIEWLLLHQYSVTSGQYHRRIKKHPEHFYRTAEGKWYINREFAEALLQLRNGYQQLTKVQGLPQVVQLELKLFEA